MPNSLRDLDAIRRAHGRPERVRRSWRIVGGALALLVCAGGALAAQASRPPVATPSTPAIGPPLQTLLGDIALILRPEAAGVLSIGVAGERRSLSLSVRASDARRWADSAARLLTPPRRRPRNARAANDSVRRDRVVLEEPGIGAGSLVLSRTDSAGARHFLLFADDAALDGIRQPLSTDEATTLVRLMRRASTPPAPARRRRR